MQSQATLENTEFYKNMLFERSSPTLSWLKHSFDACDKRGSAAYYSQLRCPIRGWSAAYPETTGYIIETLLDYYNIFHKEWMLDYALAGVDWLCEIQKGNGAMPGGIGEYGESSIFNTGMILFGWCRAYEHTNNPKYLACAKKAVDWLIDSLESDGSWKLGAYITGHIPSYYTRVIWAILEVNKHLKSTDIQSLMQKALEYYKIKRNPNGSVTDWAFDKEKPAFTHTIAYTMRGFLESSILLNDTESLLIAKNMAFNLIEDYQKHGKLAGAYDLDWKGDFSFVCITGNAQLALNLARLYQISQTEIYKTYAILFFESIANAPSTLPFRGVKGSIAGSSPYWGKYQPLQKVNWAAKFWLDALLITSKMA